METYFIEYNILVKKSQIKFRILIKKKKKKQEIYKSNGFMNKKADNKYKLLLII